MRSLHSVLPPLPYPDIPCLNAEIHAVLQALHHGISGNIRDIWHEDDRVRALWRAEDLGDDIIREYIIDLSEDYRSGGASPYRLIWLRDDLRYIKANNSLGWTPYNNHYPEGRGQTHRPIDMHPEDEFGDDDPEEEDEEEED